MNFELVDYIGNCFMCYSHMIIITVDHVLATHVISTSCMIFMTIIHSPLNVWYVSNYIVYYSIGDHINHDMKLLNCPILNNNLCDYNYMILYSGLYPQGII